MSEFARKSALAMLERFETEAALLPKDAEGLVSAILRACGHAVTESGFAEGHEGVDCYFTIKNGDLANRIAVEVKSFRRPVGGESVEQALRLAQHDAFDRAWVISRSGFSRSALLRADGIGAGLVDLLGPAELRNWIAKHAADTGGESVSARLIRETMRQLAYEIAANPEELRRREWRDLERILREVFEGIGFRTELTRPGKDGGFDLELVADTAQGRKAYLVEVKHWFEQKPGSAHLAKLIKVSVERKVTGAMLLSTSGFTKTISSGLLEAAPPMRLGDGGKIVALCKTFLRLSTGYWLEEPLVDTLHAGTRLLTKPSTSGSPMI